MRINKYLSEAGLCSRREADRLIAAGRVTVGGITARTGMQVEDNSDIRIDGRRIGGQGKKVYLKFYKPRGIVCTADRREPGNLTDYLQYPVRVTYAGRLDKDSEGLLLLTNDGDLIDQAMRASNVHEKEYQVTVDREYEDPFLEKLQRGIYLKELRVRTRPCRAWRTGPKSFRIVLTQGLNRQIRRMCRSCGFRVITLRRVRILNLTLEGLKPGEYRELTEEELSELKTRVGGLQHG